jgi:hypothetical protein
MQGHIWPRAVHSNIPLHGRTPHHKTFFAGFTGFGLLYETETGPETKKFF